MSALTHASELVLSAPAAQGLPGVESAVTPSRDRKRGSRRTRRGPKATGRASGGREPWKTWACQELEACTDFLQLLAALLRVQSVPTTLTWARSRHCLEGLSSTKHSIWSGSFFNPLVWKDVLSLGTQASGQLSRPWPSASPFLLSSCPAAYVGTEDGVLRRG